MEPGNHVNIGFFTAAWVSAASVLGVPSLLYGMGFAALTGWFGGWFFVNALIPIIAHEIRRPEFPVRTMPGFMRLRFEPFAERSRLEVYAAPIDTPPTQGAPAIEAGALFDPPGTFTLAGMVGVFPANSIGASVPPHWPTRLLSAKDVRTAVLAPLLSNGIIFIVFVCPLVIGIGGRVLVPTMPEGTATDRIVPLLATQFMHPAVAGVILAAIFAAALSTTNGMVLHRAIRMYLGLYWKRADRRAANVSSMIGPASYAGLLVLVEVGWVTAAVPPVLIAIAISTLAMVVCSLIFPPAPREAWEPYFEEDISPSTRATIDRAMRNLEHRAEPRPAAAGEAALRSRRQ